MVIGKLCATRRRGTIYQILKQEGIERGDLRHNEHGRIWSCAWPEIYDEDGVPGFAVRGSEMSQDWMITYAPPNSYARMHQAWYVLSDAVNDGIGYVYIREV